MTTLMVERLRENARKINHFDNTVNELSLLLQSHKIYPRPIQFSPLIGHLNDIYTQLGVLTNAIPPRPSNSHSLFNAVMKLLYMLKEHLHFMMWTPDGQVRGIKE